MLNNKFIFDHYQSAALRLMQVLSIEVYSDGLFCGIFKVMELELMQYVLCHHCNLRKKY